MVLVQIVQNLPKSIGKLTNNNKGRKGGKDDTSTLAFVVLYIERLIVLHAQEKRGVGAYFLSDTINSP